MNFYILTLFPQMLDDALGYSVIGRGCKEGIINIKTIDIRKYSNNKHNHVDDYPYGGGCGMVMKPEPVYDAFKSIKCSPKTRVVYMTPQGKTFNQEIAEELSKENELIILCGHYEGVDERVIEEIVTDEISIGDFVLTGGEIGAMAVIDAVARLIPGVLGKEESFMEESFSHNTLEYSQYTRPPVFMGRQVPEILLSGHHKNINEYRRRQSLVKTYEKRPDLYERIKLTSKEKIFMNDYILNRHKKLEEE